MAHAGNLGLKKGGCGGLLFRQSARLLLELRHHRLRRELMAQRSGFGCEGLSTASVVVVVVDMLGDAYLRINESNLRVRDAVVEH